MLDICQQLCQDRYGTQTPGVVQPHPHGY